MTKSCGPGDFISEEIVGLIEYLLLFKRGENKPAIPRPSITQHGLLCVCVWVPVRVCVCVCVRVRVGWCTCTHVDPGVGLLLFKQRGLRGSSAGLSSLFKSPPLAGGAVAMLAYCSLL